MVGAGCAEGGRAGAYAFAIMYGASARPGPGGVEPGAAPQLSCLFATFAPKALRPRLAAWLEQPVLVVPELRAMIRTAVRAYRIRRPSPLPLSEEELSTIRTPLHLVLGKRSLLVHPQRQAERVPRLIPGARAEIISDTGHGPQIDHAEEVNRRMLNFMDSVDRGRD